jgi:hypothetical protein
MDEKGRAEQIARIIQEALRETGVGEKSPQGNFTVTRRGGCIACDPGSCPECGHLFTGEAVEINHKIRGKIILSDRAVHYLSHGITRYQTGYIVHGEPVIVDMDLGDLAGYLDS